MKPTAISQLIEQVGKIVIALAVCLWFGSKIGMDGSDGINIGYAAAGALLGTSIAEAFALLYMLHRVFRANATAWMPISKTRIYRCCGVRQSYRSLLALAIPITIGASIVPLASFIDSGMIINRLVEGAGFAAGRRACDVRALFRLCDHADQRADRAGACYLYEHGAGDLRKRRPRRSCRRETQYARGASDGVSTRVAVQLRHEHSGQTDPCDGIPVFLAGSVEPDRALLLTFSGFTSGILFTVVQATSGILQGLHKQKIPMYTLLIGVLFKVLINYFLIATPGINILGASIGSLVCYGASMVRRTCTIVHKHTGLKWDPVHIFFKPLAASALMAAVRCTC